MSKRTGVSSPLNEKWLPCRAYHDRACLDVRGLAVAIIRACSCTKLRAGRVHRIVLRRRDLRVLGGSAVLAGDVVGETVSLPHDARTSRGVDVGQSVEVSELVRDEVAVAERRAVDDRVRGRLGLLEDLDRVSAELAARLIVIRIEAGHVLDGERCVARTDHRVPARDWESHLTSVRVRVAPSPRRHCVGGGGRGLAVHRRVTVQVHVVGSIAGTVRRQTLPEHRSYRAQGQPHKSPEPTGASHCPPPFGKRFSSRFRSSSFDTGAELFSTAP